MDDVISCTVILDDDNEDDDIIKVSGVGEMHGVVAGEVWGDEGLRWRVSVLLMRGGGAGTFLRAVSGLEDGVTRGDGALAKMESSAELICVFDIPARGRASDAILS
jgi:hypothetical protein